MKPVLILAIASLLSAPAAGATWYFAGSYEPTTELDSADWMWQDAPEDGEDDRLYFAAFAQSLVVTNPADANPNIGALHTDIEVSNAEHHEAILGVWIDCNDDGYIGLAESALREYPAALLSSLTRCPPEEGPQSTWTPGAHNYNGWVSEFVMIGRDATVTVDKRLYIDDDARVWGDYQRPDEAPYTRQCVVAPQPRGTWQSTGGALTYTDCRVDVLGATNLAMGAVGDPLGLMFSDVDDGSSGSLGQHSTFGSEDDAERAVTVWDCRGRIVRVGDELNESGLPPEVTNRLPNAVHNLAVANFDPSVDDTSDPNERVAGTVNHTLEGTLVLAAAGDGSAYNCDTSDDVGNDVYEGTCGVTVYCVGEGDRAIVDPRNKTVAAWNLGFTTAARGAAPWNPAGAPLRWHGPSGPPAMTDLLLWEGSRWSADSYWSTKPGFSTLRTDLASGSATIAPGYWLSFYAYVSEDTLDLFSTPSDEVGTYGATQCGTFTSGIRMGWNCDVSLWNRNPDGTPIDDDGATDLEHHEMIVPGQKYQLRDVDCYDGEIGGPDPDQPLGVGVQPAFYGADPCV